MTIKLSNNSCTVRTVQFLHLKNSQHGFAKGHHFLRQLVESATAFLPNLCLNSELLLSRSLETSNEEWCVTDVLLACHVSKLYRPDPDRCWDSASPNRHGVDASQDRLLCFYPMYPSNMRESIRHTRRVPFSHVEHLLCWSKVLVQPQACSNHCMCTCTSVQTHRMAENSYLAGNNGEKGWLAERKACWNPRNCIFTSKKIIKSLIQS